MMSRIQFGRAVVNNRLLPGQRQIAYIPKAAHRAENSFEYYDWAIDSRSRHAVAYLLDENKEVIDQVAVHKDGKDWISDELTLRSFQG